ncbi:MAG: CapA family protein, partial [Bacillota bacterium]|nr:CapA family protein [Bacillota bacterium]
GANINDAKKPVFIEKDGIKFGFLSYNLAGPSLGWAMSQKAGTNYVNVQTAYVPARDMPGCPAKVYTWINPEDKAKLADEIHQLKESCDVAVIFSHMGNGGDIPKLEQYETEFTHFAIDEGADIIFGHHHHVLKGVDVYKGKPIYYGLGNFVTVTYAMTAGHNDTPEMVAYLKQRAKEGRGNGHYKVDFYPWSEKSRITGIAKVYVDKDGNCENSFIPCLIEDNGHVVPKTKEDGGQAIFDFLKAQSEGAGLTARFEWSKDGKEIIFK